MSSHDWRFFAEPERVRRKVSRQRSDHLKSAWLIANPKARSGNADGTSSTNIPKKTVFGVIAKPRMITLPAASRTAIKVLSLELEDAKARPWIWKKSIIKRLIFELLSSRFHSFRARQICSLNDSVNNNKRRRRLQPLLMAKNRRQNYPCLSRVYASGSSRVVIMDAHSVNGKFSRSPAVKCKQINYF